MYKWLSLILFLVLVLTFSCAGGQSVTPASNQPPATPGPTGTSTTETPSGGQSVDQLSQAGRTVYSSNCIRCHGDNGQGVTGPAVIGTGANLNKYNTAKGLYDYLSTAMPAFAPGSLPPQSYLQVLVYLLVENKYLSAGTMLDPSQLNNIKLTK